MLLASLALALFAFPQTAPKESKTDDAPKVWENLGVMRRMLARQLAAHREKISTNPAPKAEERDGDGRVDGAKGADGDESVARSYLERVSYADGSLGSDAEYVPGLAAVFSVSVPVKVQIVETEPAKDEGRKPSETKNADDEAWDRVARGDEVSWDLTMRALSGKNVKAQSEPQRELRYDDAAVKALKETLFDTVARFGSKLGCGHGERIVVVARLTAGNVVNAGANKGDVVELRNGNELDYFRSGNGGPQNVYTVASNRMATTRRVVMQVSADDVRAFKSGDLDRDELLKKTRFDEFNTAAAPAATYYPTWNAAK
jgi:hypothetical protein